MYEFLLTVWRDQPDGTSVIYQAGEESSLDDWPKNHIESAIASGLIKSIEPEGVVDGKGLSAPRAHSARRT